MNKQNKTILIIDGQGGGCGKALIAQLLTKNIPARILAVGTNAMATSAMLKAGAHQAATGENAVLVNSARADFIAGPIGIILANALMGECSPAMAAAVASAPAPKVLIPISKCGVTIAGFPEKTLTESIADAVTELARLLEA